MNPIIKQRFSIPISVLSSLLKKCEKDKNPGLLFYSSGGRNSIFQLEALCRVYRKTEGNKLFDTWYKDFKKLEDLLGSLDFLESSVKEFGSEKELKPAIKRLFEARFREEVVFVDSLLRENGWLSGTAISKLNEEIEGTRNSAPQKDKKEIALFLIDEMEGLEKDYRKGVIDFTRLEGGVHEFRRKLRWISIYAQVLNGLVQLRGVKPVGLVQSRYCSDKIIKSPFNIMPAAPGDVSPIVIQSKLFYAMSWLISFLGDLKDAGQKKQVFDELIQATKFESKKSQDMLVAKYTKKWKFDWDEISAKAEYETDVFLYDQRILKTIARDIYRSIQSD